MFTRLCFYLLLQPFLYCYVKYPFWSIFCYNLRHEEEVHVRYDVSSRAQKDNSDLLHPINVNNVDLCDLEQSISTTSKL